MANVTMRLATAADMETVDSIYCEAIDDMNARNIPQWDEIYPTPAILAGDLAKGELHVAQTDTGVVGAVVLNEICDPAYQNGQWVGCGPALIVHRLCISPAAQGCGVGRGLMAAVEEWAKREGYREIRLDAFSQNPQALRMYNALGYAKRGEAVWRKGLFYLMEKQVQ